MEETLTPQDLLAEESPTLTEGSFELNDTVEHSGKAHHRGKKVKVTHEFRQPTFKELQDRDAAQPYRSQDVGGDTEQVLADISGKADVNLYNKLIVRTKGYKNDITPEMKAEEREQALQAIPSKHKVSMIRAILKVESEVVYDDEAADSEGFEWNENQTYRVRTEIGGKFVVYTNIKEPNQRQIEDYDGATKFYIERGHKTPVTKITVDLAPAKRLFDVLVESNEGFTFDGQPIDVKNPKHVDAIGGYVKRSIIDAVMKETAIDLGE